MARFQFRRSLRFENLEARQLMSSGGPTAQEQSMIQLINEARTNPAAAAAQITSPSNLTPDVQATLKYYNVNVQQVEHTIASAVPQPPLAWSANLANAALGQSQYEAEAQIQTHTGSGNTTSAQRIEAAGYTAPTSTGENTYAYGSSVMESMQAFLMDWGVPSDGHRINIQQPGVAAQNAFTSLGIGLVQTSAGNPSIGPMVVTQDFASQANTPAQVVGVAYNDNAGSGFYQAGEGVGNVQIDAVNLKTGAVSSTTTWDAGGYELPLLPGQYRLIASLNDKVIQSSNITVSNVNIEQDFILTNTWQGGTLEAAIAAAQPQVAPPVSVSVTPQATAMGALTTAITSSQPSHASTSSSSAPSSIFSLFMNSWSAWNAPIN